MFPDLLNLDTRIMDLEALLRRWHEERDAAAEDAIEDAREIAAMERQAQDDADALADAIDAGDCDADGEPIEYDRYHGGV